MKKIQFKWSFTTILLIIFSVYAIVMVVISSLPNQSRFMANPDSATVAEDNPININVLANDLAKNKDEIIIESFTQGSNGSVSKNQNDNTLRYVPRPNFHGTDSFTYTIRNAEGETSTATVSITVVSVNDLPIAENDFFTVTQGSSILMAVMVNDSDVDQDTLIIHEIIQQPAHGVAQIEGDVIRYTAPSDFVGTVTLYYRISDQKGGLSNQARVTIQVNASN